MKKILISVLIVLLLILFYFTLTKGIDFLNIKSINTVKAASEKLENDFNYANELSNKTYPAEVEELENAMKQLKISKQEYESKRLYNEEENFLGTIQIKKYKIHYLWTTLGNYRKNRGIQSLSLDLKSTEIGEIYDLEFTLIGSYIDIIDFIYDIENDEELNFEIENLKIEPNTLKTVTTVIDIDDSTKKTTDVENPYDTITEITTSSQEENNSENKTTIYDPKWVKALFTVKDIGITLD